MPSWINPPPPQPSILDSLPSSILPTLFLTSTSLLSIYLYQTRLRRFPNISALPPRVFSSQRILYGYVPRVGDGDGFRLFHTPCGRWLGWGWLRPLPPLAIPGKRYPSLADSTLGIRIAGVDAPEMAHFGREGQWHGKESTDWLRERILGKFVKVKIMRRDQYDRLVGNVRVRRWWGGWRDLGLEMIETGMAIPYEGVYGAEFDGREAQYRAAEERAKKAKLGLWSKQSSARGLTPAGHKKVEEAKAALRAAEAEALAKLAARTTGGGRKGAATGL